MDHAPSPETFHLRANGITMTGDRWLGDAERPAVVLLHGGGQTRHSWDRTAERLASDGWAAITLDARGHGDTDWAKDGDYSLDSFVNDLLAFLATLERAPVLVGASLGGITAMAAVGEHPGSASCLVLVDVVVEVEPAGVERIHRFLTTHQDGFASLEDVAAAIETYNPVRRRSRNLEGLKKNVRLHSDGRWYWHWDPAFMDNGDEPQRLVERERLNRAAANLTIPTLIVRGRKSDVVSQAGLAHMLELVPHAEAAEVGAAAHMIAGDDNDVFANRLSTFLTRTVGSQHS